MLGAILVAVAIVVALPVSMMLGGGVLAAVLGWSLDSDARTRHEGSELLDLDA